MNESNVKAATSTDKVVWRRIPGGKFKIGDPNYEPRYPVFVAPKTFTSDRDYYISETLVTRGQWRSIMGTTPWLDSYRSDGEVGDGDDMLPATYVSWFDALAFCKTYGKRIGKRVRLPSEAEWEYACRGGTKWPLSFWELSEDDHDDRPVYAFAWVFHNCEFQLHPVKQKSPNPMGVYDMLGNVNEWCSTPWTWELTNLPQDANPDEACGRRVIRGGSYASNYNRVNEYNRVGAHQSLRYPSVGFRVVHSAETLLKKIKRLRAAK